MGNIRRTQNRLLEARVEFETALALDPNDTFSIRGIGNTLIQLGQPELAIPHIEKSIRLSPHDPNVAASYSALGRCHLFLGDTDQAIDLLTKARAANPKLWYIHLTLAAALSLRGDLQAASASLVVAVRLEPNVNSLVTYRASSAMFDSSMYWTLVEKTIVVGLRRAGFPDE